MKDLRNSSQSRSRRPSKLGIDKAEPFNLSLRDLGPPWQRHAERVLSRPPRAGSRNGNAGRLMRDAGWSALEGARVVRLAGVAALALTAANCAQPQKVAGGRTIDPKYGVAASPRVIAEGDPVPKGGGRDLVGRPYVIAGRTYVPQENPRYAREGLASWYGSEFHGRLTANGEIFDKESIAAAHTTMPLPSYARVTNLQNQRSMIVRVNDRGPYHANRVIDVSQRVAEALDFKRSGTARVRVEYVGRASTNGSDDRILMATLRTDGTPASLQGVAPTMVAEATPRPSIPRESIAFRNPDGEPAGQNVFVGSRQAAAAAVPPAGRAVSNVPLPPERPFDLGTIPQAATPARSAAVPQAVRPPSRPVLAGLY
jgi:rare lipoprotein A